MSRYGGFGKLTAAQVAQLGFCLGSTAEFICDNHDELERVADTFTCGDLDEALKLIMQQGLLHYTTLCDMDDEMADREETKEELKCAKRTIEYLRGERQ